MGDHHQLGVAPELVEQAQEAAQVGVVQGGVHLVQNVEGGGAGGEHREQESQRGQGAFASRQKRQFAHLFAQRLGPHLHSPLQRLGGVGEGQSPRAARKQRREIALVGAGGVFKSAQEQGFHFLVQGFDHFAQVSFGGFQVGQLPGYQPVTLLQFLELLFRQRVDRAHAGQLGGQRAGFLGQLFVRRLLPRGLVSGGLISGGLISGG